MEYTFENSLEFARTLDQNDELRSFRDQFHLPVQDNGDIHVYMCGNSLGLQPKSTQAAVEQELKDWAKLGVEGHFHALNPWMPYHEFLTSAMANVVGASAEEVVVMNTLTVNLHLMMVSFYKPQGKRTKIIIEADAFPSDKYAAQSQIRWHGLDPKECLIELKAREGEYCLREEDIKEAIYEQGDSLALVMLGNTNYYTGQYFNIHKITQWGHEVGAMVGFDCAHAAGNMDLQLSDSNCDFAVWCNYKYLNAGPGGLGGAFVNKRHHNDPSMPRLEGWWGHNKSTRFKMRDDFDPIPTTEAWQLSNPPILAMVSAWSSLKIFEEAGMNRLRSKAKKLTSFLEYLVLSLGEDVINIITPSDPNERGSQLSIQVKNADKKLYDIITEKGVIADWREPDVIRVAPTALYNSYEDVFKFYSILKNALNEI